MAPTFAPPPLSLTDRTQRPGELADVVPITLDGDVGRRTLELAEHARLPLALYVVCAVEAERALAEVARALGTATDEIAPCLDDAAADSTPPQFEPPASRPLRAYARALRYGGCKSRSGQRVELVVPDRLRARWSIAAQEAGMTVEAWIAAQLATTRRGVERWEAQAAAEARTLSEWVALQALSRCRRSSTSAQASAAG